MHPGDVESDAVRVIAAFNSPGIDIIKQPRGTISSTKREQDPLPTGRSMRVHPPTPSLATVLHCT